MSSSFLIHYESLQEVGEKAIDEGREGKREEGEVKKRKGGKQGKEETIPPSITDLNNVDKHVRNSHTNRKAADPAVKDDQVGYSVSRLKGIGDRVIV